MNTAGVVCGGNDPREIVRRALQVAERTERPLLYGSRDNVDWPLTEQLSMLRPGDVFTYCFRADDAGIMVDGRVRDEVWEARKRDVLFDVGHGMNSFHFQVAEAAIAQGFLPDTASTDLHRQHLGQSPRHDLPRTASKLIAAGMSEREVFARITSHPAEVLGLGGEVGALMIGACADIAVLRWSQGREHLADTRGVRREGPCLQPVLTVRAGAVVPSDGLSAVC